MRWILLAALAAQDPTPSKYPLKLQLKAGATWKFEQSNHIAWSFERVDENSQKQIEANYKDQFKKFTLADKQVMDFEVARWGDGKVETVQKDLALSILKVAKVRIKGKYFGNDLNHTIEAQDQKLDAEMDEGVRELLSEQRRNIGSELRHQFDALGRTNGKEPHFVFGTLPEAPVPIGEKWEHASSSTLDPLGIEVEVQASSMLVSVEKDVALIHTTLKVVMKGKPPDDKAPKFEVEGAGSAKAEIDLKLGRVLSASSKYDIKVTMTGTDPDSKKPLDLKMDYRFEQGERFGYTD